MTTEENQEIINWDFSEIQYALEQQYENPEQLLLGAYKSIFDLMLNSDLELAHIKDNLEDLNNLISPIYRMVVKYRNEQALAERDKMKGAKVA